MKQTTVMERTNTRKKTIGNTVYIVKSLYSGRDDINKKILNLIKRKAEMANKE